MRRSALTVALVALISLPIIAAAPGAHNNATFDAGVTVDDVRLQNQTVESVTLTVRSHEAVAKGFVVVLWGLRDHRQHVWANATGHKRHQIRPNGSRTVTVTRGSFNLGTKPDQRVMVAIWTPDGIERTHTIFRPGVYNG